MERPSARPIPVLLNASAGWRSARGSRNRNNRLLALRIGRLFAAYGARSEVRIVPGRTIGAEVARLRDAGVSPVIVAGGDGTVSGAAAALVGSETPLAILPLGTVNHLSKDLRIGNSLPRAVRIALRGRPVAIDTAEVNGRVFVNNSSLGLYPRWVRRRYRERQVQGRGRWGTLLKSFRTLLRRFPRFRVVIRTSSRIMVFRTFFVFVGNNEYRSGLFSLGRRPRLNSHQLQLRVVHSSGRMALLRLIGRALTGRLRGSPEMDSVLADDLWIFTGRKRVHVALDGEVEFLRQPLHYRVRPASLRVLVA